MIKIHPILRKKLKLTYELIIMNKVEYLIELIKRDVELMKVMMLNI